MSTGQSGDDDVGFVLGTSSNSNIVESAKEKAPDSNVAALRTAREFFGGGYGESAAQAGRNLHVTANPDLQTAAPRFLPKKNVGAPRSHESVPQPSAAATLQGSWASRAKRMGGGITIIQEDIFDSFAQATQVLYGDVLEAEAAADRLIHA